MDFYRTSNSQYGQKWISTDGQDPRAPDAQVKTYREIAEIDLSQRTGLKLLKSKVMQEKKLEDLERGEPDPHMYDPGVLPPKTHAVPVKAESMKYPGHGLKGVDNPKYMTSNREYGRVLPTQVDLPAKYFPLNNKFTNNYGGERLPDTGLNTFLTPSRVHPDFDS